eukprot:RCo042320
MSSRGSRLSSNSSQNEEAPPIVFDSEKDLRAEFDRLGAQLVDITSPWAKRVESLRRVKSCLLGGASSWPNFVQIVRQTLREPLINQLKDLRTVICLEACAVVQCLCSHSQGPQWEAMSDWWLPSLFRCAVVTIAVVADNGNSTLRFVVRSGRLSARAMNCILEHTQSKHSACRARAAECILLMLQRCPGPFTERCGDALEKFLKAAVEDPVAEIRSCARLSWWAYHSHHPQRADRLLTTLEPSSQKQISEDAGRYLKLEMPEEVALLEPTPDASAVRNRRLSGRSSPGLCAMLSRGGVSSACNTPTCGGRPHTPVVFSSSTTRAGLTASPSKAVAKGKAVRSSSVERKRVESPRFQSTMGRSLSPGFGLSSKTARAGSSPTELSVLLPLADHPLWSSRVKFFETMGQILIDGSRAEIIGNIEKVVSCYLSRLSDTHYKVVQAALHSLTSLLQLCPSETEPYMERLLVKVFQKQGDAKEQIRIQAKVVTTHLLQTYFPSTLIPALLKVLGSNAPRVRVLCTEYLISITSQCAEYLSAPSVLRMVLLKLVSLIMGAPHLDLELEKVCVKALLSLHEMDPDQFAAQAAQVTPQEQMLIHAKLGSQIPDLQESMKRSKAKTSRHGYSASSPCQGDEDSDKTPGSKASSNSEEKRLSPAVEAKGFLRAHPPPLASEEVEGLARNIFSSSSSSPESSAKRSPPGEGETSSPAVAMWAKPVSRDVGRTVLIQPLPSRPYSPQPYCAAFESRPKVAPTSVSAVLEGFCGDHTSRQAALRAFLSFLTESPADAHALPDEQFSALLEYTMDCLEFPEPSARRDAFQVLQRMIGVNPGACNGRLAALLSTVLRGCAHPEREVS